VLDLIFFSFLLISKKITTKSFLKETVTSFNFNDYLINDEIISSGIKNYNYPKEVFNYIDNNKVLIIKNKIIDDLEISENSIKDLLINSLYEYENRTNYEIKDNIENDINLFSNNFVKMISDYSLTYNFLNKISNSIFYPISLISSIVIILLILFIDKDGIKKISIILFCYSFILYYFNNNLFKISNLFKYKKNNNIGLEKEYIVCFIFSFVLLLIYMCNLFRKFLRNQRIKGYL